MATVEDAADNDTTGDPGTAPELPVVETDGERTAGHERLESLVGTWHVEKVNYLVGPSPDEPATSRGLVARKEWMSGLGRRFLADVTAGEFGGQPYHRFGVLGYSVIDDLYEWTTVDGGNAMQMVYRGAPGSGGGEVITMEGEFTHAGGLFADDLVGARIHQRTTLRVEGPDRHVLDIYFTPPGGEEILADHGVYTRAA